MTVTCDRVGVDFFDTAPTIHYARLEVAASPERVFAILLDADADAWVTWAFPITGVDWTSGLPLEVGSTRTVHMRGELVGYEEFIAYEHGIGWPSASTRPPRRASEPLRRTTRSPAWATVGAPWSGRWRWTRGGRRRSWTG